jgi:hypothetical protein
MSIRVGEGSYGRVEQREGYSVEERRLGVCSSGQVEHGED